MSHSTTLAYNGLPLKLSLEQAARECPGTIAAGGFEGHILSIVWDPDTGYTYRWNGEAVTEGKAMEYLRHE